jgi:hypothetical protein
MLLLENTKDNFAVVCWCAAFALTEIAKSNLNFRKEFRSRIKEMAKKEEQRSQECLL